MKEGDSDKEILERARKRFKEIQDSESENRTLMADDAKFNAGNPDNGWQWPEDVRRQRMESFGGSRPCLTSNRIGQHVLGTVNDIWQNKPALKFIPGDGIAAAESAEMLNDLVRRIQYESDADVAYATAVDWAVTCGVGYIRVLTEYDGCSFDQKIKVVAVPNIFSVYLPEDAHDPAAADARYAFITDFLKKEEFEERYPGHTPDDWDSTAEGDVEGWYSEDTVRIAEYWEKKQEEVIVRQYADGTVEYVEDEDEEENEPEENPVRSDLPAQAGSAGLEFPLPAGLPAGQAGGPAEQADLPAEQAGGVAPGAAPVPGPAPGLAPGLLSAETAGESAGLPAEQAGGGGLTALLSLSQPAVPQGRGAVVAERKTMRNEVCCYTVCGHGVIDRADWAGEYIPIARVIGNAQLVDGKMYYSGMVRNAKDAQRMINFWDSQEAEMMALAPKAPFVVAAGQLEGFEKGWTNANQSNIAYLEYNPVVDSDMGPIQVGAPQRQMPPVISPAIHQGKAGAVDSLKAVTGIYDASLGQKSNETSGRAIIARQRQGDLATFHYTENLSRAIKHIGRIILDVIPTIMDTKRKIPTMAEDGTHGLARINPDLNTSYAYGMEGPEYNLCKGKFDVMAVTGQSYSTKRQEAADSMIALTQANPALFPLVGDLLVRNLDWPGADEIAQRLRSMVPPQALQAQPGGEGMPGGPGVPPGSPAGPGGPGGPPGPPGMPPQARMMIDRMQQQMKAAMDQAMAQIQQLTTALNAAQDAIDEQAVEREKLALERAEAQSKAEREDAKFDLDQRVERAKTALETQRIEIDRFKAQTERMALEHKMACENIHAAAKYAESLAPPAGTPIDQIMPPPPVAAPEPPIMIPPDLLEIPPTVAPPAGLAGGPMPARGMA